MLNNYHVKTQAKKLSRFIPLSKLIRTVKKKRTNFKYAQFAYLFTSLITHKDTFAFSSTKQKHKTTIKNCEKRKHFQLTLKRHFTLDKIKANFLFVFTASAKSNKNTSFPVNALKDIRH